MFDVRFTAGHFVLLTPLFRIYHYANSFTLLALILGIWRTILHCSCLLYAVLSVSSQFQTAMSRFYFSVKVVVE